MSSTLPQLEAVYYATPVPQWKHSLTLLGLVFDRIHFPHVYLPQAGTFDPDAVAAELRRIEAISAPRRVEQLYMLGAMRAIKFAAELHEICLFTGDRAQSYIGPVHKAGAVIDAILDAAGVTFPPNFIHTPMVGLHKDLDDVESIDLPGALHYPAMALLYSIEHGIPLVNDDPGLPVPGTPDLKGNAKALASLLALKCVEVALPRVPPLTPPKIVELRRELKPHLAAFRSSIFRLSGQLSEMLTAGADHREIEAAANLLVDTQVRPAVADLERELAKPSVLNLNNAMLAAAGVPAIVAAAPDSKAAVIMAAFAAVGVLANEVRKTQNQRAQSGFYYMLELQAATRRR